MSYKVIQLTNTNLGAVAVNEMLPFGKVTRKLNCKNYDSIPFTIETSGANVVIVNECGYYKITYNASLLTSNDGLYTLNLLVNGVNVYSVSETASATANYVNLTLPYEIRVLPNQLQNQNSVPVDIQVQLQGTAITGGTSNILIEKMY